MTPSQAAVASPPVHVPVSDEMLFDASIFSAVLVLFALIAFALRSPRRRSLLVFSALAAVVTGLLWLLARAGHAIVDASLYQVVREGLLALLAFAVLRGALIFVSRVALKRANIPLIVDDIVLTLGLIAFALSRLSAVGVNLAGVVTTSAVITGAIAFSAQEILGALWAGLALQAENSVRQGDWIRFGDKFGQIVNLRWRSTAIVTPDHETIVIPNAALVKGNITVIGRRGEERSQLRRHVPFAVTYDTAPNAVTRAVQEALERAEIPNVARDPAPVCVTRAFEDSGIGYEVLYHIIDLAYYAQTDSAVLSHVFAALKRNGLAVPFPQRIIHVQQDEQSRTAQREHDQRLAVVRSTALFAPLTEDEKQRLAAELKAAPFAASSVVFRQGETADSLFVLATGTLGVYHEAEHGERRRLAELNAPAYFGEMGLLTGQPRRATIVAHTDALCFRVERPSFDAILRKRPEVVEDLSRALAQRQAENDATLHALDAEARARKTRTYTAEIVRAIRSFFAIGPATAQGDDRKTMAPSDTNAR